eukprot:Hpha_TRINITY_DN16714_c0_g3::TRINITY_DN16714_c0_g3_i3::g.80672::m.80672
MSCWRAASSLTFTPCSLWVSCLSSLANSSSFCKSASSRNATLCSRWSCICSPSSSSFSFSNMAFSHLFSSTSRRSNVSSSVLARAWRAASAAASSSPRSRKDCSWLLHSASRRATVSSRRSQARMVSLATRSRPLTPSSRCSAMRSLVAKLSARRASLVAILVLSASRCSLSLSSAARAALIASVSLCTAVNCSDTPSRTSARIRSYSSPAPPVEPGGTGVSRHGGGNDGGSNTPRGGTRACGVRKGSACGGVSCTQSGEGASSLNPPHRYTFHPAPLPGAWPRRFRQFGGPGLGGVAAGLAPGES